MLEVKVSIQASIYIVEELPEDCQSTDSSSDSVTQYIYSFFPRPLETLSHKAFR